MSDSESDVSSCVSKPNFGKETFLTSDSDNDIESPMKPHWAPAFGNNRIGETRNYFVLILTKNVNVF